MENFQPQQAERIEDVFARVESALQHGANQIDSRDDLPFNQINIYEQLDLQQGNNGKEGQTRAIAEQDFTNSLSSSRAYDHDFFDDVSKTNQSILEPVLGEITGRAPPHDGRTKFVTAWLHRNYEISENTSFPRSAVYDQYLEECKNRGLECVNPATFGKVIRAIFKNLKTRRLGTRGNSKYHYFGIRPIVNKTAEPISMSNVVAPVLRKRFRMSLLHQRGHECTDSQESCAASTSPQMLNRRKNRDHSSIDVTSRQHKMIQPLSMDARYHPLIPNFEEFARFLEQICQPILESLPRNVAADLIHSFSTLYQGHVVNLLRLISSRDFPMIEMALGMFWNNIPQRLWSCLHCEEGLRIISIADDYLFQVAIHILVPDVLESLPLPVAQSIRYFAKSLEIWMTQIFDSHIPEMVVESKTEIARRFCQVLRRRTSLNHLAQAVHSILGSPEHVNGMLRDFTHIEFGAIRDQVSWVITGQDEFIAFVEASFKNYLFEGASLQQWTQWIEGLVEQCLASELASGGSLEAAARAIILRWSFFTTMVMRDMTLRSASSFGSYHLLRLLFDEYVMFYLEKKLDEHRRAIGLMEYWPSRQDQSGQLMSHSGFETAMAGFASMDELFRKSGLLAYSQPLQQEPHEQSQEEHDQDEGRDGPSSVFSQTDRAQNPSAVLKGGREGGEEQGYY